jgi:hypothetical protein
MIDTMWTTLPFPFGELAQPVQPGPLEMPCILERLLEDCAGLAGVISSAAQHPECDEDDVKYAARVLAEHLHATVALWRQWEAMQAPHQETKDTTP